MKIGFFNKKYVFADSADTLCFTCCHVLEENKPIRYISHDEDGCWQFLCGQNHTQEEARVVSLAEIVGIDKEVNKLAYLKYGEYAEKDWGTERWIVRKKQHT